MWSFYLKPQNVELFHASTSKARVHAPLFKRALTNKCGCVGLAETGKVWILCWGHLAGGIGATVLKKRRNTTARCEPFEKCQVKEGTTRQNSNQRGDLQGDRF